MNSRNYKVTIDRTPEQIALVKAAGSKNKTESLAAMEAIAEVAVKPLLGAIEQAAVFSSIFETLTYGENDAPVIPLDDYFDIRNRNFLNVWTSAQPGGTATNFVQGTTELYVQTYALDSAISFNKNYLRVGKIDHLANGLNRLAQEILMVKEANAAYVFFTSLAQARVDGNLSNNATNNLALARANAADVFGLDDFNTVIEGYDNVVKSWVGGTPVNALREVTDFYGSPKWMAQIRSIAYQPQNTRNGSGTGATSLAAPDSVRESIFRGGSIPTFFDKTLHKVYEMGVGASANVTFGTALGAVALPGFGQGYGGGSTSTFDSATQELVVGINTEMDDLKRLAMTPDGSEMTMTVDDTFTQRSGKTGITTEGREGYVSLDGRSRFGLVF